LMAAGLIVAPWLIRNEVYFGSPFLTKYLGRAMWYSCFRGRPTDRFNPPIPFAEEGPATQAVRRAAPNADPRNAFTTYKELVQHGYSQIDADELMLRTVKEAIRSHPREYLAGRCIRSVWFWITPNGTFRPNTGDFDFGAARPKSPGPAVPADGDEYAGQAVWKSDWYFMKGGLNFLWHPHPLLYAAAAVVTLTALVFLLRLPACRPMAIFFALWLAYFAAVIVMATSPEYRYRMILEPTMIMIVVAAWCRFRMARSEKVPSPATGRGSSDCLAATISSPKGY